MILRTSPIISTSKRISKVIHPQNKKSLNKEPQEIMQQF
jgi:hypothetical protein